MRPIATDGVAWSVGLSVTAVIPSKTAEPIDMPFEMCTRVGQGTMDYMGVQIPNWEGHF